MLSKVLAIPLSGRERVAPARESAIASTRLLLVSAFAVFTITLSANARAATITVDSLADSGGTRVCTLRSAITAANTRAATNHCPAGTGKDTINFSVKGTITLASNLPPVKDSQLTINGPASPGITIDGGRQARVMQVGSGATLSLNNLTIANGVAPGSGGGYPLDEGGGIFSFGKLTVTNSTFSGNSAVFGGGIFNNAGATLTVTNSTFSGNSANEGGGIFNLQTLTVTNSTFSNNSADMEPGSGGGGIFSFGMLTVTNSTFSGNSGTDGGGIYNLGGRELTLTNSTFSGNSASCAGCGGAIFNNGSASIKSAILAASGFGGNCAGIISTIINVGYNISDDDSCGFTPTGSANNGDGVDPLLSPAGLTDNGGPTQTIGLQAASPAIDAIPVADCTDQAKPPKRITTDQRGFPRPDAGEQVCDIGAYESQ